MAKIFFWQFKKEYLILCRQITGGFRGKWGLKNSIDAILVDEIVRKFLRNTGIGCRRNADFLFVFRVFFSQPHLRISKSAVFVSNKL